VVEVGPALKFSPVVCGSVGATGAATRSHSW